MLKTTVINLSKKSKRVILLLSDIAVIILSYYLVMLFQYASHTEIIETFIKLPLVVFIYVVSLIIFKMYSCIWLNAGVFEFKQTVISTIISCIITTVVMMIIPNGISVLTNILAGILIAGMITALRMSLKVITRAFIYTVSEKIDGKYKVLIIGAGDCASAIMNEIRKEKSSEYNIVGIIDDNKSKINSYLNGVKILGDRDAISEIVERENIDVILFAIAKIDGEEKSKILDIYENNVYDIQNELSYNEPKLNKKVIIASVRDKYRLNQIISAYRPSIIFHAAAHKHVPLMEDNPGEAIKNNVLGTLNMAELASQYKVEKFVLISTDKAVNPTNVMGASKRLCEMIVQAVNNERGNKTDFVAVRFGNVLGSNGSVIPLFKRQIKSGGPVTLTHRDITRYFMLIPEAAQLVLQAGAYAKGGEIFVLDMGKAVKIYDLAENLIRLSGYKPNEDIKIKITGLRPGEKLYEELLMNNDELRKTAHNKIFIDKPETISLIKLRKQIDDLIFVTKLGNKNMLIDKLKEIVPTYYSPDFYNKKKLVEEVAATTLGGKE